MMYVMMLPGLAAYPVLSIYYLWYIASATIILILILQSHMYVYAGGGARGRLDLLFYI